MKFRIKNNHFYYASLALLLLFLIVKINLNYFYCCKGKFIFNSISNRNGIYVYEKNKLRFITDKASFPKWNPDGDKILAINNTNIVIINAEHRKVEKNIKIPFSHILDIAWLNNGADILYSAKVRKDNFFNFFIVKYNLEDDSQEILYEFLFKQIDFDLRNITISHNDKFVSFFAGSDSLNSYMYLLHFESKNIKYLWQAAYPIGWMPNNQELVFFTTKDRSGANIEDALGSILKINIITRDIKVIEPFTFIDSQRLKMTKDGNYLYYSKRTVNNGFQIMYSKLRERNSGGEIEVIKSKFINDVKGFSKDLDPDWYL